MEKITRLLKSLYNVKDGENEANIYWLIENFVCQEIIYNKNNNYFSFIISYNENCPMYYKFMYNDCLQRAKNLKKDGKEVFIGYEVNNTFKLETSDIYCVIYILSHYTKNELLNEFNDNNLYTLGISHKNNFLIKNFYDNEIENNMNYFSKKNQYIELFENSENRDLYKIKFIKSDNDYKYYEIYDVINNDLIQLVAGNEIKIPLANTLTPNVYYNDKCFTSGTYVFDEDGDIYYNIIY